MLKKGIKLKCCGCGNIYDECINDMPGTVRMKDTPDFLKNARHGDNIIHTCSKCGYQTNTIRLIKELFE